LFAVAIGNLSGQSNQDRNAIAIGSTAGQYGQQSAAIAIGSNAGNTGQGVNAIAIGVGAGEIDQAARSIVIDASNASINPTSSGFYVNPIRSAGSSGAVVMYYNQGTKEITSLSSSRTTKNTIKDLATDTTPIYGLQPRTFIYNTDPGSGEEIGYIAEEVKELNRYFASYYTPDLETPVAINYNVITVFLVEEIKKLKARIEALENRF
jgi:hypothetical protein